MRTLIATTAVIWTLVRSRPPRPAAPGGAEVIHQDSCEPAWFGTVCTTIQATTNLTATPSGNVHYVTNGTVERQLTFSFGGSFTTTSDIHLSTLQQKGELHVYSERSTRAPPTAPAPMRSTAAGRSSPTTPTARRSSPTTRTPARSREPHERVSRNVRPE